MVDVRTCESVCAEHPDKLADQIAAQILDDILRRDPSVWVAVEVMAAGRRIVVTGEIITTARVRIRESVRETLRRIGYNPIRQATSSLTSKRARRRSTASSHHHGPRPSHPKRQHTIGQRLRRTRTTRALVCISKEPFEKALESLGLLL